MFRSQPVPVGFMIDDDDQWCEIQFSLRTKYVVAGNYQVNIIIKLLILLVNIILANMVGKYIS